MRTLGEQFNQCLAYPGGVVQALARSQYNPFRVDQGGCFTHPRVRIRDPGLCCETPFGVRIRHFAIQRDDP